MAKDTNVIENNQQGYIGNVPEEIFTKEILEKLSVQEQWKLRLVAKRYKEIVDKKYPLIIKVNNVSKLGKINQAFKDTQYYIKLDLDDLWQHLTDDLLGSKIALYVDKIISVNLKHCNQITDTGLGYIAANCKELTALNLSWCKEITDIGLGYIAANCKELTVLSLNGCNQITDTGLGHIAKLTQLTVLSLLNQCGQIKDVLWLEHIAANCKQLTVLDLNWCKEITDIGLGYIANNLKQLTELNLYGCNQISKKAKLNLIASLPKLDLKQCQGFNDLSEKEIAEARRSRKTDTHCATEVKRRKTSNNGPWLQNNN